MKRLSLPGFRRRLKLMLKVMSYLSRSEKIEFLLRQRVLIYTDRGAVYRIYFDPLYKHTNTGLFSAIFISDQSIIRYITSTEKKPVANWGRSYVFCSIPYHSSGITRKMSVEDRFIALILLLKADDLSILKTCNIESGGILTTREDFLFGNRRDVKF